MGVMVLTVEDERLFNGRSVAPLVVVLAPMGDGQRKAEKSQWHLCGQRRREAWHGKSLFRIVPYVTIAPVPSFPLFRAPRYCRVVLHSSPMLLEGWEILARMDMQCNLGAWPERDARQMPDIPRTAVPISQPACQVLYPSLCVVHTGSFLLCTLPREPAWVCNGQRKLGSCFRNRPMWTVFVRNLLQERSHPAQVLPQKVQKEVKWWQPLLPVWLSSSATAPSAPS